MKKIVFFTQILGLITLLLFNACRPVRNFKTPPSPWDGRVDFRSEIPANDTSKKNVFIIADARMTVLFDMLAPFYLFNATEKANVYIVAKDKTPILIKRDLFVNPQITFNQADSMNLQADVIVIPALSRRDEHQDTKVINWIRAHFSDNTKILAVCDGASTAAATGLYDGKPLTCHASDYEGLKMHFSKPNWVKDIAVTKSGNLFSTAGVSNAVEGSLTVINELFGKETMQQVLVDINYPQPEIKTVHKSISMDGKNKFTVVKKIIFRKNKTVGLLLENGINEFDMASILEIYGRSFPASFNACNSNTSTIQTKYGLTMIMTINTSNKSFNELHVLTAGSFSKENELQFSKSRVVRYDNLQNEYLIDICLKRIAEQYGQRFANFVKVSLDYN